MSETKKRGRAAMSPETAAERRRLWLEQVEVSGLLSEQIAYAIKVPIPTVRSYGCADGSVPPVAAINALARRNRASGESEMIQIGLFDE